MRLELLDDLVGIRYSSHLLELFESFSILLQLTGRILTFFPGYVRQPYRFGAGTALFVVQAKLYLLDLLLFICQVLLPKILYCTAFVLKFLEFGLGYLLGMGSIVSQQQKFFEITLFAFEASLNRSYLVVVTHSLFLQPLDDLLVGLPNGVRLVILDHGLVQPTLKNANFSHQGTLFNVADFVVVHILELVLQYHQPILD